jgi:hypothetical protein
LADQRFDAGGLQLAMKAVWEWEVSHGSLTLRHETFRNKLNGVLGITKQYVGEKCNA